MKTHLPKRYRLTVRCVAEDYFRIFKLTIRGEREQMYSLRSLMLFLASTLRSQKGPTRSKFLQGRQRISTGILFRSLLQQRKTTQSSLGSCSLDSFTITRGSCAGGRTQLPSIVWV